MVAFGSMPCNDIVFQSDSQKALRKKTIAKPDAPLGWLYNTSSFNFRCRFKMNDFRLPRGL